MSLLFDALLAMVVLALGWRVVAERAPVPAAIAFIAYGLALALAWVRLAAVDVALTEAAVGGGITGMVLLRAAGKSPPQSPVPSIGLKAVAALLSAAVALALAAIVLALPEPAPTLAPQAAGHLPPTGLGNPVTGVLLVFRALDTLLETVVLLVGLIAVWALSKDRAGDRPWQAPPPPLWSDAPHPAQDLLARMLAPVGVLVAIYMFWAGADVPGGAFQGGAVLAAMWLLLMTAGLAHPPRAGALWLRAGLLAGPFGFLAVGLSGWATAGVFLGYPAGWEKPVIVAVEVAITLSIGITLALMVLEPPGAADGRGAP